MLVLRLRVAALTNLPTEVGILQAVEAAALVDQVRDACMNVGFLYGEYIGSIDAISRLAQEPTDCVILEVSNHGIPDATIDGALSTAKTFFSLPLENKMEVRPLSPYPPRLSAYRDAYTDL